MKTKVIFRTFKSNNEVIALFPCEPADNTGLNCQSYMHVGQHGAASPELTRGTTRLATREEINPLYKELTNIGYNLCELKRFPRNAFEVRKKLAKSI